jgi:hypothetical protein
MKERKKWEWKWEIRSRIKALCILAAREMARRLALSLRIK